MIELRESVCIEASPADVWARLARLEEIELWSEAVRAARCEGALTRGVGAVRTCDLVGGVTITERWTSWTEGEGFTYEGSGIPLVARARNTWAVRPDGDTTLLTSHAQVVLKGGLLGRLLEPLVGVQIRRLGPRTLAAFKYLVEHGEPAPVKHSLLPRPATC